MYKNVFDELETEMLQAARQRVGGAADRGPEPSNELIRSTNTSLKNTYQNTTVLPHSLGQIVDGSLLQHILSVIN